MFVDSHLHLQDPALWPHVDDVLARARAAGVTKFVCNGTHEGDWQRVLELARKHADVVPCFALHPWFVGGRSAQWLKVLEDYLDHIPSAVGEIGLDRWVEPRDETMQEEAFRAQLHLARQRRLPVMIHCLRAWGWLMDVLEDEAPLPAGMLIHAYGGPVEMIQPLAKLGAHFSFAGNVFEPKRVKAREALGAIPANRLLIETDAPDMLPPVEYRSNSLEGNDGKLHNEPANIPAIFRGVAGLRGVEVGSLAQQVRSNLEQLLEPVLKARRLAVCHPERREAKPPEGRDLYAGDPSLHSG